MSSDPSTGPTRRLEAEGASSLGLTHTSNEDAYLIALDGALFAVADGMGGHRDGDIASRSIVSILARTLDPAASFEARIEEATRALESVNGALYAPTIERPDLDISGSTVVGLIVGDAYACCLWVGDSRLYLFRDGALYLISEDHAFENGMLTRAVGSRPLLDVDRRVIEIRAGDLFLLCSDGLMKGLDETDLADILAQRGDGLVDRLIAKSIAGGSGDDITVVLIWIDDHGA